MWGVLNWEGETCGGGMKSEDGRDFVVPELGRDLCFTDAVGRRLLAFSLGWAFHVGFGGLFGAKKLFGMN